MPIILIFGLICGFIGAFWAQSKNLNAVLWGLLCFFFPLIGLLILAFQSSKPSIEQPNTINFSPISTPSFNKNDQDEKWDLLVKYDTEIKAIVNDLAKYGDEAIAQLAKAHMAVNDKAKLSAIAEKIKQDIEQEFSTKTGQRIAECNVFKFETGMIYGLRTPLQFFVVENAGTQIFNSISDMENGIPLTKNRELIFGTERENLILQNADKMKELIQR